LTSRQRPNTSQDSGQRPSRLSNIKLRGPQLRTVTIRRPRLTKRLVQARAKLVLVVASPGFGKTSLLADWAEHDLRPFAWVTLDRGDSDPAVFWSYIAAALAAARNEPIAPDRLAALARDADPAATLARELDAVEDEIVLALDDYFLVEGHACHDSLLRFIQLAPPTIQVVIASRLEPALPIARMRAGGQVVDIGTPELRFTPDESQMFLNESLGLGLEPQLVRVLHDRTEGWPAGLYLAYLSLRGARDRAMFVTRFGASNRHVGDYLTEQVLAAQEPETLGFMLATSVVDQVCGPLADALIDSGDSAVRLAELERANVFLTPLDENREWYRYHHLLRELLLLELRKQSPESEAALHVRASEWFEAAGDADRAIRHAIDAGDTQRAARLISANYMLRLELGQLATIASWLDRLGDDVIEADARLGIVKAWTMHFLGRHAEAWSAMAAARRSGFHGELPDGTSSVESSASVMAAAFPGGDVGAMLEAARRAFELESDRAVWRVTVRVLLGFALVREGSFAEAEPHLTTGEELAIQANLWMDAVGARSLRARVAIEQGETRAALELARSAVELAEETGIGPTAPGGFARSILGAVLVRTNDPEDGIMVLNEALAGLRRFGEPLPLAEALLALAEAHNALGNDQHAALTLSEADALIDAMTDPGALRDTRRAVATAIERRSQKTDKALSRREMEVLRLLAAGLSKRDVATRLFVSYNTVHSHVRTIYRKLGVGTRAEAVALARRQGIVGDADTDERKLSSG
jgi:LuxR family maltose regulon positive regulatory protein